MRRVLCLLLLAVAVAMPVIAQPSDLGITDQRVGDGAEAKRGMNVTVHYTGWLYDEAAADHHGAQVDSSRTSGGPMTFHLGAGEVVKGWDKGIVGMKVGGQRELVVPAALGYGRRGVKGVVPPDAALIFEIELLAAKR